MILLYSIKIISNIYHAVYFTETYTIKVENRVEFKYLV